MDAAKEIKLHGGENDLITRILTDTAFSISEDEINVLLNAEQFTGIAKEQTDDFLAEAKTVLDANRELLGIDVQIIV